ncbi:MAG: hypothetical protein AAGI72_07165 [Pseudomonadota bacterium]
MSLASRAVSVSVSNFDFWRSVYVEGRKRPNSFFSFVLPIKGGRCGVPELHQSLGVDTALLESILVGAYEGVVCSGPANETTHYFLNSYTSNRQHQIQQPAEIRSKERRRVRALMSREDIYSLTEIDRLSERCRSECSFTVVAALAFAYANSLDASSRPLAANSWRRLALSIGVRTQPLKEMALRELQDQLALAYHRAAASSDLGGARMVLGWAAEIGRDSDTLVRAENHLRDWIEEDRQRSAPVAATIPLVSGTALSRTMGAFSRGLDSHAFSLEGRLGEIRHLFVQCRDRDAGSEDRALVNLDPDETAIQKIPERWESCEMIALGVPGARLTVLEYPGVHVPDGI